jgi:hypothetical protein
MGRAQALLIRGTAAGGVRARLPDVAATGAQHQVEEERERECQRPERVEEERIGAREEDQKKKKRKKGRAIWSFDSLVYHVKLFCQTG